MYLLKSILFYLLLLMTSVRFVDMSYLLAKGSTNLPVPVIVVTSAMILYGIVLIAYKLLSTIRMKQMVTFYLCQTGMIIFNLCYVSFFCPLQISMAETLLVGTFLDLLVNVILLYVCFKRMRSFPISAPAAAHMDKREMRV